MRTTEIKNEIDEIENGKKTLNEKDSKYKTNQCTYDFQQFETIRFFGKINIDEVETKPKTKVGKANKKILLIV